MLITELEIEIIADNLANFHDWEVGDLRDEFLETMMMNEVGLSQAQLSRLYDAFLSIEANERFQISFNHRQFVEEFIENLLRNFRTQA